eukprot:COSAG04_NODE_22213_length_359_cov_0.438462_1_plen_86_part_10
MADFGLSDGDIGKLFAALDRNHDGKVSLHEWLSGSQLGLLSADFKPTKPTAPAPAPRPQARPREDRQESAAAKKKGWDCASGFSCA